MMDKWLISVKEMNKTAFQLDNARRECYGLMSDKIKKLFNENSMVLPKIHFTNDASRIECTWNRGTELFIPVDLIMELGMPFDFNVEIRTDGEWVKKLTFYPLGEEVTQ